MPTLRMRASSSLESAVNVTVPSMSSGEIPASSMAARAASDASCSSLRPEFLENSVWPMPTMAALFFSEGMDSVGRHELRQRHRAVVRLQLPERDLHGHVVPHIGD